MKIQYKGIGPNRGEVVPESAAVNYVLSHVGLAIEPQTVTKDTLEALEVLKDWFFSGNWLPQRIPDDITEEW